MYHEVWRIERDFLYDPRHHGLDLATGREEVRAVSRRRSPRRDDLNYLFEEMLGDLTVGHMFVGGGERPKPKKVKGGLLGADYTIENGRYRFARVYNGENWNPGAAGAADAAGRQRAGRASTCSRSNGRELHARATTSTRFFEETAGKQVRAAVGPNPDGSGARDVTVVPVESEENLRHLAWIEGNRRKVDELTGGQVAYVYLPEHGRRRLHATSTATIFAQVGKQAAIIDERFNDGGQLADYIVDSAAPPLMSMVATRDGADCVEPVGSDLRAEGDDHQRDAPARAATRCRGTSARTKIGPLVGKRTWGGLVGIGGYPQLIDGGAVTAPRWRALRPRGRLGGREPRHGAGRRGRARSSRRAAGHDPQLEKRRSTVVMRLLKEHPLPEYKRPTYPNYHEKDGLGRAPGKSSSSGQEPK